MLCGNIFDLILIMPPQPLVLDPLNTLDLCLRHGQLKISLQPSPLVLPLRKVLDHDLFISCQQLHRVLPEIREVVGLSLIDYLLDFNLYLVVLEPNDLEVLVRLGLDVNDVAIASEVL